MDHLPLPAGRPLTSRRLRGNPVPERVIQRQQHGAGLAQALDEIDHTTAQDDDDADFLVVLKFAAATRLANGPFAGLRFTTLGEGDGWTYFVLSSRESREQLTSLLADYATLPDGALPEDWDHPKSWAAFMDSIEGIELYGADDRRDVSLETLKFDTYQSLDCLIWPSKNELVAEHRIERVRNLVTSAASQDFGIHVEAVDPRPDRTMVRVRADLALLNALLNEASIERVRAPLRPAISQADMTNASMPVNVPEPSAITIGVVDGIVSSTNPLTGPYVMDTREFPDGYTFSGPDPHGTAVAGVAIWGNLDPLIRTGTLAECHPIHAARVLDVTASGGLEVPGLAHLTIESAIRWLAEKGDRIVNVSINFQYPASSALRDELTTTIDMLAQELGLVIVVSAGNRDVLTEHSSWISDYPKYLGDDEAKIAAPGDAALAITVGSVADRDIPSGAGASSRVAIAAAREPSPFTRSGPVRGIGQAGMLKPEFVHHGGNWAWDHLTKVVAYRDPGTAAVVAIAPSDGRIVGASTGTSYSAPAVAHELARIAERYPSAGPNLLRALLALSARQIATSAGVDASSVSGYGRPDADVVLESEAQRTFLVYEGVMVTNSVVLHRLPIPPEFADGVRNRIFRVALAFDPPVRRSRREYIAGSMAVDLVRGLNERFVGELYSRQPTRAEVLADPKLVRHELPDEEHRPRLSPGIMSISSNTLLRREFVNGLWDPDHGDYFLVLTHNQSPWTRAQRRAYREQTYSIAVEVSEQTSSTLDLYASISAQLRIRTRVR